MVFSTPIFLTVFLPLVLAGAWGLGWLEDRRGGAAPRAWTNAFLLAASLFFYFWGEGRGVCWLAGSIAFNALAAQVLAAREGKAWRRGWLGAGIAGNLAFLGWFKYAGFAARSLNLLPGVSVPVPEVALPLGISFYTFQAMSYVWDVYRREVPPARRWADFACYVALFPQLVAGPIVRYADIAAQLRERRVRLAGVASGFKRFLCGLGKKVLLANTVAEMADGVWGVVEGGHGVGAGMAWLGAACYALQIYYDFSGYSDMAIGMGRMLGFEFKENFRHPYAARSIREFWRKWHISLSTWFRDYLYIPLGGNRKGRLRTGLNCLVVFGLCGLWHGASAMFVLWGLWHGLFLLAERWMAPPRKARGEICQGPAKNGGFCRTLAEPGDGAAGGFAKDWQKTGVFAKAWQTAARAGKAAAGQAYALGVVLAGWVLFRSESLGDAGRMFRSMAGMGDVTKEARVLWLHCSPKVVAAVCIGAVLAYPVAPWLRERLRARLGGESALLALAEWLVASAAGAAAVLCLAGGAYNPFIYFRF